jgi:hypothetical protein
MNQYILHHLSDYSIDEERLKILAHTPYLFRNFHALLTPIKSPKNGGFMFLKGLIYYNWDWDWGLELASEKGHLHIANLMIEKGARSWNWSLSRSCLAGHLNIVNLMIKKGATRCYYCDKSIPEHLT